MILLADEKKFATEKRLQKYDFSEKITNFAT